MPDKPTTWRNARNQEIPLTELTASELQAAYNFSEQRALQHYEKSEVFTNLLDALELEAERRKVELTTIEQAKQAGNILSTRRIWRATLRIDKK